MTLAEGDSARIITVGGELTAELVRRYAGAAGRIAISVSWGRIIARIIRGIAGVVGTVSRAETGIEPWPEARTIAGADEGAIAGAIAGAEGRLVSRTEAGPYCRTKT